MLMRRAYSILVLTLLLTSAALSQQQQAKAAQAAVPAAATDCFATFTSGAGATAFNFCITANGNVLSLQSPAGVDHIRGVNLMEGYTICDHTLGGRYWDLGAYSPNGDFLTPAIVEPNGPNTFPLTITRTTWDGLYTLKQTYSRSVADKSVLVTMALTNNDITFTGSRSVSVWRGADFDVDGSISNWGGVTKDSAMAWNNVAGLSPGGHGAAVTSQSLAVPHTAGVETFGVGDPACPTFRRHRLAPPGRRSRLGRPQLHLHRQAPDQDIHRQAARLLTSP
jgi:hypothetical protein